MYFCVGGPLYLQSVCFSMVTNLRVVVGEIWMFGQDVDETLVIICWCKWTLDP